MTAGLSFTEQTFCGTPTCAALYRSEDEGHTWHGPAVVANGLMGMDIASVFPHTPVILSDGVLFVPVNQFGSPRHLAAVAPGAWPVADWSYVISRDGGVTFEPLRPIVTVRGKPLMTLSGTAHFIADTRPGPYRDRMYVVFAHGERHRPRLYFSMSADRGATWSEPKLVDPSAPVAAHEYHASKRIAVNKDGIVGVSWVRVAGPSDTAERTEYFTASLDGGETFLPPIQVSSASWTRRAGQNNSMALFSMGRSNDPVVSLRTMPQILWAEGEYLGLTADAAGVFHPFWADARDGTYQIYTARVMVEQRTGTPELEAAPRAVTRFVELKMDQGRFDGATGTWFVPVRLRNVGKDTLYGPITVEVKSAKQHLRKEGAADSAINDSSQVFLNSSNDLTGAGAVFDYTSALGTLGRLEPGGYTDTMEWRISMDAQQLVPDFRVQAEVKARVAVKRSSGK